MKFVREIKDAGKLLLLKNVFKKYIFISENIFIVNY